MSAFTLRSNPVLVPSGSLARKIVIICTITVSALAILSLVGRIFGIDLVRSLIIGAPQMAVTTAVMFILACSSLILPVVCPESCKSSWQPWILRIIALTMKLVAILGVLGWMKISVPVFGESVNVAGESSTGMAQMSLATAISFFLLALSIATVTYVKLVLVSQWLAIAVAWMGWLGISRYLFGGEPLAIFDAMSLPTAIAFMLSGTAMTCLGTGRGIMWLMNETSEGASLMRRVLPFLILVPIAVSYLVSLGEHYEWYGNAAAMTLLALLNVSLLGFVVVWNAHRLHVIDSARLINEEQAKRLAAVVKWSDDAIVSIAPDGQILSWNSGASNLYGLEEHEALGKPFQEIVQSAENGNELACQKTVLSGETIHQREAMHRRKNGEPVNVSLTSSPIRGKEGGVVAIAHILRDISEPKKAQERMRAQLARLDLLRQVTRAVGERHDLSSIYQVVVRCLEEQLPADFSCICLYDRTQHILTVTQVGVKSSDLAMSLSLRVNSQIPIDQNGLSRCVQGTLVYEADLTATTAPFGQRLLGAGLHALVLTPLLVDRQVVGVILVARLRPQSFTSGECEFLHQLSDHVGLAVRHAELYAALQQAYDDLRQTQQAVMQNERLRAVGQMASGIAHDINNALFPIIAYCERLLNKESQLSDRARNEIQVMMRAGQDIAATVNRMREFYRRQEKRAKMSGIDLNEIIHEVIKLTQSHWRDNAQRRGKTINVEAVLDHTIPFVVGVENELREALTNLILNAIDAMPEGGQITISTHQRTENRQTEGTSSGQLVEVVVADTGVGMDEVTKQRCIEPFFTTKGERGTGLGLAMVFGIVHRHGGEIQIVSEVGKGTKFHLVFSNVTTTKSPTELEVAAVLRRLRLLLIDDDPIILKALSDFLEDDGHEVVVANNGHDGIAAFTSAQKSGNPFDVVITDLGMPMIDGRRVAAEVKQCSPATPVMLLTGWGQTLIEDAEPQPNIDLVLSKPPKQYDIKAALLKLTSPH